MIKKIPGLVCILLIGCGSPKSLVTDPAILSSHAHPVKIFGIGYWPKGYMILTLVDEERQYFTMTVRQNKELKIGDSYPK